MESKMRLTLYNDKSEILSDRLVEQEIEFRVGPKEGHDGPMRLEVNLKDKEDATKAIAYLEKLTGKLPIQKMKLVKLTKGTMIEDSKEPLEELLKSAISRNKTQEELINFLRDHGFRFIESDIITEISKDLQQDITLKEMHQKYQFMIRMVKEAKNPLSDKYDSRMLVGIKLWGKKFDKIVVYMFGKFHKSYQIPWKNSKKLNFKKVEQLMKFPEYMDYEDRKKWRVEYRKIEVLTKAGKQRGVDFEVSKFFRKNEPFVKIYLKPE